MNFVDSAGLAKPISRENEAKQVRQKLAAWAGTDREKWRLYVILELAEVCDWSHTMIATAFALSRPRVTQLLAEARERLPQAFAPSPRDLAGAIQQSC